MGVLPNLFLKPIEASVERMLIRCTAGAPSRIQAKAPETPMSIRSLADVATSLQWQASHELGIMERHRPDGLCDRGGDRRDDRRGIPCARRADADRPARRNRPHWRGRLVAAALESQRDELRRRRRRQLRSLRDVGADHRRTAVDRDLPADDRSRGSPARGVLRADALRDCRHDADGDRDGSAGHFSRAGSAVARGVCAHRNPPRVAGRRRGGDEVLSCSADFRARSSCMASLSPTD